MDALAVQGDGVLPAAVVPVPAVIIPLQVIPQIAVIPPPAMIPFQIQSQPASILTAELYGFFDPD